MPTRSLVEVRGRPAKSPRDCYVALTTHWGSWAYGVGLALVAAIIALPAADGDRRWLLLPLALLLGAPLVGRLLSPVESLWLEGATLVQQQNGTLTRLDLNHLCSVERNWVPRVGDDLVLEDTAGRRIVLPVRSHKTDALRRAIGQRARVARSGTHLYDPKTRHLLFLDE